jgi:tRNA(Ile)-lysidine synthase
VARCARENGTGLEEAARTARHAFYARTAHESRIAHVVLGHQADDQVETLLFRLLRGAGSRGLGSIAPRSTRGGNDFTYTLLRPLLGVWREEILGFLSARQLSFLHDASNTDLRFTRNRIRHVLLPELEKAVSRPVRESLWRTAEVLRAEDEFLASLENDAVREEWLCVKSLRALHLALQRRVVARWLRARGVPDVGFELVERVLELIRTVRIAKVNLPGAAHAIRRRGRIAWIPGNAPAHPG